MRPLSRRRARCGRSSGVERQLPKLNVVGSNPIARSKSSDLSKHLKNKEKNRPFWPVQVLCRKICGIASQSRAENPLSSPPNSPIKAIPFLVDSSVVERHFPDNAVMARSAYIEAGSDRIGHCGQGADRTKNA